MNERVEPELVATVAPPVAAESDRARPSAALVARRLSIAAFIVALDLWSKAYVFAWLEDLAARGELVRDAHLHPRLPLLGEWLTFMLSVNPGAAFGKLASVPYLLVCGRIVAAFFLIYLILRTPKGRPVFSGALVLVLGGALGNLYDNLLRTRDVALDHFYVEHPFGPVRDFIDVYFAVWDWHFPTFNVADSCITIGALLLLFFGLGARAKH